MQTIITTYHGSTNARNTRVSATASGSKTRVILSWDYDLSSEENHMAAARALMERLDWRGCYIGGHNQRGMQFVCANDKFSYKVER